MSYYTQLSIITDLNESAQADLLKLIDSDPDAAADIIVALEQIEADPLAITKLRMHGISKYSDGLGEVKNWIEASKISSVGLWRFKALQCVAEKYRIVYGVNVYTKTMCILAIVERGKLNYDDLTTELNQRILADWERLVREN